MLDKAYDFGSTDAVSKVKWLFNAQKAGHAGTLDPRATGILPIALGEATKTTPYIIGAKKKYRFTAKWGAATSTDDTEGDAIATSDLRPSRREIEAILPQFIGEIDQAPPRFSAVKIRGARAYDLARAGEEVALESRKILIGSLELVNLKSEDEAVFEAVTGKGAYVRALVRDIAVALGTVAHVCELRRTAVGPFSEDNAVTIGDIEAVDLVEDRDAFLMPITEALASIPQAVVDGPQASKIRCGQAAILSPQCAKGVRGENAGEIPAVLALLYDKPVAICSLDGLKLKPVRVFAAS
ncbi:MAG: tRNA pseudouridine(55) synthase TruB [Marinicaulis sp.]|nr:tRNA pseudouridine(55) synthase TruB [Marinicaulis sp.]